MSVVRPNSAILGESPPMRKFRPLPIAFSTKPAQVSGSLLLVHVPSAPAWSHFKRAFQAPTTRFPQAPETRTARRVRGSHNLAAERRGHTNLNDRPAILEIFPLPRARVHDPRLSEYALSNLSWAGHLTPLGKTLGPRALWSHFPHRIVFHQFQLTGA